MRDDCQQDLEKIHDLHKKALEHPIEFVKNIKNKVIITISFFAGFSNTETDSNITKSRFKCYQ